MYLSRNMRRLAALLFSVLALTFVVTLSPLARAQQVSDADRAAARDLFNKGVELQNQQKFPEALDHFERSQKVVNAPTNLLHIGQCQAALGRLVESAEAFRAAARFQLQPGAPAPFVAAQNEANTQLAAIEPRIPELKINVQPKDIPTLTVTVDDQPVNSALVGVSRPVNPGTHKVSASAPGYTKAERTVDLKEKQKIEVTLSLVSTGGVVYGPTGTGDTGTTNPPPAGSASAAPAASSSAPPTPPPPPPPRDPRSKMSIFLGARLGFTAMAGSLPNGDLAQSTTSIGDVAGPGGQLGIEAAFRVVRILYLSLTGDAAGYAGKDVQVPTSSGSTAGTTQTTTFLAAGHVGLLTNPEGFGFMGDIGAGYRYLDLKANATDGSATVDNNFGGIDYILRLGMHFKAGKSIRLFPQAEMDFGSLGTGGTSVSGTGTAAGGTLPNGSNTGQTAGHIVFFFGFGGYFDIDLDKGAGKAPTLDTPK